MVTEVEVQFTPEGSGTRVELEHRYLERLGDTAEGFRDAIHSTPAAGAALLAALSPKKQQNNTGRQVACLDINVYGIRGSPFLRSVEITLPGEYIPYHLHALAPGEHKQPEYLARHPFGRVPCF